ncbi:MAG: imelysin family protein [Bacteroidetes bacterium]|nr:imelysin family protein [Bacteroidota bacterium]
MKHKMLKYLFKIQAGRLFTGLAFAVLTVCLVGTLSSCGTDEPKEQEDEFDRKAMLQTWVNDYMIPGYENWQTSIISLKAAVAALVSDPDAGSLANTRSAYVQSALAWQKVSMFQIEKANELRLREFVNTYPCDTNALIKAIVGNSYNFSKVSTIVIQGYPAFNYLLYGLANSGTEIAQTFEKDGYANFIQALVNRLESLASETLAFWKESGANDFINNNGLGANSSTAIVVNEYVKYFEKYVRAGKVGIPAGVYSANPLPQNVEAPYGMAPTKEFLLASLKACKGFYDKNESDFTDLNLAAYLNYLNSIRNTEVIHASIMAQFNSIEDKANALDISLYNQVVSNNTKMLELYDEMQKLVVLLKVDMMQALNINVNYVDADGD